MKLSIIDILLCYNLCVDFTIFNFAKLNINNFIKFMISQEFTMLCAMILLNIEYHIEYHTNLITKQTILNIYCWITLYNIIVLFLLINLPNEQAIANTDEELEKPKEITNAELEKPKEITNAKLEKPKEITNGLKRNDSSNLKLVSSTSSIELINSNESPSKKNQIRLSDECVNNMRVILDVNERTLRQLVRLINNDLEANKNK